MDLITNGNSICKIYLVKARPRGLCIFAELIMSNSAKNELNLWDF